MNLNKMRDCTLVALFSLGLATSLWAAEQPGYEALAALISAAKLNYQPPDGDRLVQARSQLIQALTNLETRELQNIEYWWNRVSGSMLQEQAKAENPDVDVIQTIYRSLFGHEEGLEAPQVLALRDSLKEFHNAARFAQLEQGEKTFIAALDATMALSQKYEASHDSADRIALGEQVAFLEASRLAPQVVVAVQSHFGQLNSIFQVNTRLFGAYANSKVKLEFGTLFKEFFQLPWLRSGVSPRSHWLAFDLKWFYSKHIRRSDHELSGDLTPPPPFQNTSIDIGLRMHESDMTNTLNSQLAGITIRDVDVQWAIRNVLNYVPRELRVGTHVAHWSAIPLKEHPMTADFDNGSIRLGFRFTHLNISAFRDQPKLEFDEPFEVNVRYEPVLTNGSVSFERREPVELSPCRRTATLDPQMIAFLTPKIQALFSQTLFPDGLTPVGALFETLMSVKIKELRTERDWLLIGLALEGDVQEILQGSKDRFKDPTNRPRQ